LDKKKLHRSTVIWLTWLAVRLKNFVQPFFERFFQVRDFFFWITKGIGIGLTVVSFVFWPRKQIPSGSCHTNFWLLLHFHVKYWPIYCFWAWFNMKFYVELKKHTLLRLKFTWQPWEPKNEICLEVVAWTTKKLRFLLSIFRLLIYVKSFALVFNEDI
jgi:hypothetical protein